MKIQWEYKNIRDPIHGFVGISQKELFLLDTYPIQRLRRIKQLACADLIYPSAVHTRFEHSIGTLYVADKMAERIGLDDHQREVIRLASLLHDVGHGPFSHVFDAILSIANQKGVGHEEITVDIIKKVPEVADILGDSHEDVLELFEDPEIESVLKEMHKQVYQHNVRAITDAMIIRMGELALRNDTMSVSKLRIPMSESGINEFLQMDDIPFLKYMLEEDIVSEFARRLLVRDLLKIGFEIPMEDMNAPRKMELLKNWGPEKNKNLVYAKMESEIAENVGIDPEFIIIYIRKIRNVLTPDFRSKLLSAHPPLYIKMEDGKSIDFDQYTSVRGKSESEFTFFVFCPKEVRSEVKDCAQEIVQ